MIAKLIAVLAGRSAQWPAVRKQHLKTQPECQVCGTRKGVDVHHCWPYHVWPKLELSPSNLITLCRPHHLAFGHLGDWSSWNETIVADAAEWRRRFDARPNQPHQRIA